MTPLALAALGFVTIIGVGITLAALYDLGSHMGWWQ